MNKVAFWIKNARHISLPQSLLPALLAVSMSWTHESFSWGLSCVALFGVICVHLGMNLLDDYFDYRGGSGEKRLRLAADGVRARVAKYPYLTLGLASVRELVGAIAVFFACAVAAGVVIVAMRGETPLVIALIAAVLGISYSGKPLQLGYYGYGELLIGLIFGPLLMAGMQCAACGVVDVELVLVGVAVGFLVTNILYSHSVLDLQADTRMGKTTLAALLKTPRARRVASAVFNFFPFVLVLAGVAAGVLPWAYLCVLLLLPMAVTLWRSICRFTAGRHDALRLRWWYGPMGRFDAYRAAGIDWFMYRWLMARNLISFFALLLLLANVILQITA